MCYTKKAKGKGKFTTLYFLFLLQLKNSQTLIQKGTDTFQENTQKKKKGLSSHCSHFKHRFLNQQAKQVSTRQRSRQLTVGKSNSEYLMKPIKENPVGTQKQNTHNFPQLFKIK